MANYRTCLRCGGPLGGDDIAIYKKLVYRGAEEFLCIPCLAEKLGVPREVIDRRIAWYRASGECTLFR